MTKYIEISEDRLHHIMAVARKCYKIAKEEGYDEQFCKKMWLIGWLHDIGYEFAETKSQHPRLSAEMIRNVSGNHLIKECYAIEHHGEKVQVQTPEWKILNIADMTVDSKGNEVSVEERLKDIEERYGETSEDYLLAYEIAYEVGLLKNR